MKIECQLGKEINDCVDKICEQKKFTRAEFNRRAVEFYIDFLLETRIKKEDKIKMYLEQ